MTKENEKLEKENNQLNKGNDQFNQMIVLNSEQTKDCEASTNEVAHELTALMQEFESLKSKDAKFSKTEKTMQQNLYDMIDYVKLLTD